LDTSEVENLLGDSGSDNSRTSRGRDQSKTDGTTFSGNLCGDSVGQTDSVTPISSSNRNDCEFGQNNSSSDGVGNFFRAFNSQTQMSVGISNNNEGFELGSLTGSSLLLHGHNLHYFILKSWKEVIDDLVLFDRERE